MLRDDGQGVEPRAEEHDKDVKDGEHLHELVKRGPVAPEANLKSVRNQSTDF